MIDTLLSIVAPHHCYMCHKTGAILCPSCKYDIAEGASASCIVCGTSSPDGVCASCKTTYEKAWYVGARSDELEQIINDYKFERMMAAHRTLADLLDMVLPQLPTNTVIVPVPTVQAHIRQRGYDHALLIAKRLGKLRTLPVRKLVSREENTKQRGSSRKERFEKAERSFACKTPIAPDKIYLVIDDVVTTGATLQYVCRALRDAGAEHVWVAAIARQPLDKSASHLLK